MSKQLPLRQCLGIDISKEHLEVNLSNLEEGQRMRIIGTTKFANTAKGFEQLSAWLSKRRVQDITFIVVMEATGVYHESAAYFLHEKGFAVSIILPNKSKAYARSLNAKSKTDRSDAKVLAQMGLERNLDLWTPASPNMRRLKRLCRERAALQQHKTMVLNQGHAIAAAHEPDKESQKRTQQLIQFLKKQITEVEQDMQSAIDTDPVLKDKIAKICVLKGLGWISVATIVAETDGFALFKNKAQVVSYAGYDVVHQESGTSVKGITRISKKGNRHIRRALHFPALTVVRHEKQFKNLFDRTYEKSWIKMKAYVAIQRKLLVLIYTLFKNSTAYDPEYYLKHPIQQNRQERSPA